MLLGTLPACTTQQQAKFGEAATAPLNDLNLLSTPIPEVLKAAQHKPYDLPADRSCASLANLLAELDDVLGPDVDSPEVQADPDWEERTAQEAEHAAVAAVRNTAQGILPFRGWIRHLSGAERQSRKVRAALAAGAARRGFLKGYRRASAC